MTPEEAARLSADLLRGHVTEMREIAARGVRDTVAWASVAARLVDRVADGDQEVFGLVHEQLKQVRAAQSSPLGADGSAPTTT